MVVLEVGYPGGGYPGVMSSGVSVKIRYVGIHIVNNLKWDKQTAGKLILPMYNIHLEQAPKGICYF